MIWGVNPCRVDRL